MNHPPLTEDEEAVVRLLGDAWTAYLKLEHRPLRPGAVDDDLTDFRHAIHNAQRIVMSFPTQRKFLQENPHDPVKPEERRRFKLFASSVSLDDPKTY